MDLALEPEIYVPMTNDKGDYADICPASIKYGIRCPCGARTDHIYDTKGKFKSHINTQSHKNWIIHLNNNKKNIYEENVKLHDLVKNQRTIITQMEKDINNLKGINTYLETKLFHTTNQHAVTNLLDINSHTSPYNVSYNTYNIFFMISSRINNCYAIVFFFGILINVFF
jgi:hypothetical protein